MTAIDCDGFDVRADGELLRFDFDQPVVSAHAARAALKAMLVAGARLMRAARAAYCVAVASLIALIFLGLAWELVLAPLRPGGSLLALKILPLLAPLFGILRGRVYTYQWTSMLILAYLAEGAVRAWSDRGMSAHAGAGGGATRRSPALPPASSTSARARRRD